MARKKKEPEITEFFLDDDSNHPCSGCGSTHERHEVREFSQEFKNGVIYCQDCGTRVRPYYHNPWRDKPNPYFPQEGDSDSLFDIMVE